MNILGYLALALIGSVLWAKSGVSPRKKYFWVGLSIMLALWWVIWGQFAVFDGWWTYSSQSISLGHIGTVPAADLLYFFAGLGWYFYLCRKLNIL